MLRLLPFAAAVVVTLGIAGAFGNLPASSQTPSTTPSPSPSPEPSPTAVPTWVPLETPPATAFVPAETPALQAWSPPGWYAGTLRPGVWVRIIGTDSCLNVRVSPGLYQQVKEGETADMPVLNCLPDGFVGQLSFGPNNDWSAGQELPIQADGYSWWYVLGQGWVADEWLTFVQEGGSPFPVRPELSDAGLIAFARSDGVWLASADGSSSRLIYPVDNEKSASVGAIHWSPDGRLIAVGVNRWDKVANASGTEIIDVNGTVVAEYPGLTDPNWSPDGRYLSALRINPNPNNGSTPVVFDMTTGSETPVGPSTYYSRAPEWAPDGSAVVFICRSNFWQESLPDGTIVDHPNDCGGDGVRIVSLADGSVRVILPVDTSGAIRYDSPTWSPDGTLIAVYEAGGECDGYALIDVASGTRSSCLPLPQVSSFGFGGCGGSIESGASDWSPDGQTLAYHWQFRAGQNGVALVNVATGERRMILSTQASSISFSGDGAHLTFESSGYIWTADSDASDVQRLTDGWAPAWQPLPQSAN